MSMRNIKSMCEHTKERLQEVISALELFLNTSTLKSLSDGCEDQLEKFNRGFLSDIRHLLVYSEVHREKLGLVLRRPVFDESHAERLLHQIYHQCVNAYFNPTHECYTEDGRYAYTGQNAIRFREKPNDRIKELILDLYMIFEDLREELSYYESDFVTKKHMMGGK